MLTLCTACGPRAFIDVEVTGELAVPTQVDNLTVIVSTTDGNEIGRGAYRLDGAFPQHVILEPSSTTDGTIEVRVTGYLADEEVARGGVRTSWREDAINDVVIALQ